MDWEVIEVFMYRVTIRYNTTYSETNVGYMCFDVSNWETFDGMLKTLKYIWPDYKVVSVDSISDL